MLSSQDVSDFIKSFDPEILKDPKIVATFVGVILGTAIADIRGLMINLLKSIRNLLGKILNRIIKPKNKKKYLWQGTKYNTKDGILYKAETDSKSDLLIVLIHGVLGDPASCWEKLPELLQTNVSEWSNNTPYLSFDILSLGYPSKLFHKASIEIGEQCLSDTMKGFPDYKHIIFITYSTGGLVLKKALINDMITFREKLSDRSNSLSSVLSQTFVGRTRQVINFSVPHSGGSFSYSLLLFPLYLVLGVLLGLGYIPQLIFGKNTLKNKNYQYGLNLIGWELRNHRFRRGKNTLQELEKKYRQQVDYFDSHVLPRPFSIEITGRYDSVIDKNFNFNDDVKSTSNRTTNKEDLGLILRGSHPSLIKAKSPNDNTVLLLTQFLKRYEKAIEIELAHKILLNSLKIDRSCTMIGTQSSEHQTYNSNYPQNTHSGFEAIQADVFNILQKEIPQSFHCDVPLFLVSGDIGTGKTVVLRTFARKLAISFLNYPSNDNQPIPILFPMELIKGNLIGNLKDGLKKIWNNIIKEHYLEDGAELPTDWLENLVKSHRTVIILDSVDEFLLNYRNITSQQFRKTINNIQDDFRQTTNACLVAGIRWGEPILQSLEEDAFLEVHVRRLSLVEACHYFSKARSAIESVIVSNLIRRWQNDDKVSQKNVELCVKKEIDQLLPDSEKTSKPYSQVNSINEDIIQELSQEISTLISNTKQFNSEQAALSIVRTPLVLSELELESEIIKNKYKSPSIYDFPHQIMDRALTCNIRKARLPKYLNKLNNNIELKIQDWKMALALISMSYSSQYISQMNLDDLQEIINTRKTIWRNHVWTSDSENDQHQLNQGLLIISNNELLNILLSKTIFYPLDKFYRFKHREWQDFLLGKYFSFSFKTANLKEVVNSSFTTRAHLHGGNILVEEKMFVITQTLAQSIITQMKGKWGHFILGNLGALVAKSPIPISRNALTLLFSSENESEMPHGGKFVLFSGLGYRILRSSPENDKSYNDICRHLIPLFQRDLRRIWENKNEANGILHLHASLAYCYLKKLKQLPDNQDLGWPELRLTDRQEKQIIHKLHNECNSDERFLDDEHLPSIYKTCQKAFLTVQLEEYNHAHRQISLAHYLYVLCLSYKHGASIQFVRNRLPSVLNEESMLFQAFSNVSEDIPILEIFRICQKLYQS